MSPQRIVLVPARRFTRFVNRPQVQAAFAILLLCTAALCSYLAWKSWQDNRNAAKLARIGCERTRFAAPKLDKFFVEVQAKTGVHALDEGFFRLYRSTIPKDCS